MAAEPGNEALLPLPLVDLLAEEPGHDPAAAARDVALMLDVTGARDTSPQDVKLTWLFHRKATRARLLSFADVTRSRRRRLTGEGDEPWPGFPLAPRPNQGA
ncbi:hypothetical protein [Curtobacterium sp. 20TX0008]|uniref:hypothetical protein n=1 Tax=Curtobacterium sp. 20TX0008 TaxID=3022018 RepID=UPI00232EF24F|nr:hypothetical protein [Curtobacterium sp. 20TX0008]MDB6425879.1 hypothetical protein [Curtobacterium sp. 20TX0008]